MVDVLKEETCKQRKIDINELNILYSEYNTTKQNLEDIQQQLFANISNNKKINLYLEQGISLQTKLENEFIIVDSLNKTANGELVGKQKLAFEQYVQASYFNKIIIEANKRLRVMTNDRFELIRKEDATNLRTQSGLELDVIDNYTGRIRTVKSLSGGESFKASLALALGLSDVIQSHAGGVQIDTMFIDEGFGSLDNQSLDQAINILGDLTDGNRLVGII